MKWQIRRLLDYCDLRSCISLALSTTLSGLGSRIRRLHSAIRLQKSRAWDLRVSMRKAQEGVWLLVISLPYPRQTLPKMDVNWPSRARDACAKPPVARRDFPAAANPCGLKWPFSSTAWVDRGRNNWRSLPSVYIAPFHPHYDPPILFTGMRTCRCSGHLSSLEHMNARSLRHR